MKVYETNKSLRGGIQRRSFNQRINVEELDKAVSILRDKIYTDKLKAAVSEPIANAVDEHRKHGVNSPVSITLYTDESYKTDLYIRDFAKGLSDEDCQEIFFQYLKSTKSHSNDAIGGFGIGAKAPGAYTHRYYVATYHNGVKTTYLSTLDGNASVVTELSKKPCDINNTGILVKIPIDQSDISRTKQLLYDLKEIIGGNSEYYCIDVNTTWGESKDGPFDEESIKPLPLEKRELYPAYSKLYNDGLTVDKLVIVNHRKYLSRMTETGFVEINDENYYSSECFRYQYYKGISGVAFYDGDNIYASTANFIDKVYSKINELTDNNKLKFDYLGKVDDRAMRRIRSHFIDYVNTIMRSRSVFYHFERGELSVSPSRETVELTNNFVDALVDKIVKMLHNMWCKSYELIVNEFERTTLPVATFINSAGLEVKEDNTRFHISQISNSIFNHFPRVLDVRSEERRVGKEC